jgi:hypothetical protein
MVFDTAVSRVEEITLGVVCAAIVHGLIFPKSAFSALEQKLRSVISDTRRWLADALTQQATPETEIERRRIAADVSELYLLGTSLPSPHRPDISTIRAFDRKIVALLPLASAIEDRLTVLRRIGPLDTKLSQVPAGVYDWLQVQAPGAAVFALIDSDTFRVEGYFEETKLRRIRIGEEATVKLIGDARVLSGRVESIAYGIEDQKHQQRPTGVRQSDRQLGALGAAHPCAHQARQCAAGPSSRRRAHRHCIDREDQLVVRGFDAPELTTLAIILWVALCVFVSLLDRTPRSYMFVLSGYTAALIGFPSVLAGFPHRWCCWFAGTVPSFFLTLAASVRWHRPASCAGVFR